MTIILKGIKAYEAVVDGKVPAEGAYATEVDAFNHLCDTASTIFIQVVSQDILENIVELEKPYRMWTWLRTEYYRHSAYAPVSQILNLVSPRTQYFGNNLSDFQSKFVSQWLHHTKLSKGSSDLDHKRFEMFLKKGKAKRDFWMGFLFKTP